MSFHRVVLTGRGIDVGDVALMTMTHKCVVLVNFNTLFLKRHLSLNWTQSPMYTLFIFIVFLYCCSCTINNQQVYKLDALRTKVCFPRFTLIEEQDVTFCFLLKLNVLSIL